jgi:hypothetical protein
VCVCVCVCVYVCVYVYVQPHSPGQRGERLVVVEVQQDKDRRGQEKTGKDRGTNKHNIQWCIGSTFYPLCHLLALGISSRSTTYKQQ